MNIFYEFKVKHINLTDIILKLNLRQIKFLYTCATFINSGMFEFNLKYKDVNHLLGYNYKYKLMQEDFDELLKLKIRERKLFKHIVFRPEIGLVSIKIQKRYFNTLKNLSSNYTLFGLNNIISLKHKYSVVLYCLLKQYESIGTREVDVIFLKRVLGYKKDTTVDLLKRTRLNKELLDINKNTDISVSYYTKRVGRKIDTYVFSVKKNRSNINLFKKIKPLYEYILNNSDFNLTISESSKLVNIYSLSDLQSTLENMPVINHSSLKKFLNYLLSK